MMAVTKRTRYEVLRRDNHACRYCGAAAPDAKLTIDHVTPIALGGTDDPSNLVAACGDCNAGKASTNPDADLVADVRDDALRHAELTRQAYGVLAEQIGARAEYTATFYDEWGAALPHDWKTTLGRWHRMGVPLEIILEAADIAMDNDLVYSNRKFQYMCGIVWNQVSAVTEEVSIRTALDGAWLSEAEQIQMWQRAYDLGAEDGAQRIIDKHSSHIGGGLVLHAHVDGRTDILPEFLRAVA